VTAQEIGEAGAAFLKSLVGILGGLSRYGAAGAGFGGIAGLIVVFTGIDVNPYQVFFFAFFIPPGILFFVDSSAYNLRRYLRDLKQMVDEGLISEAHFNAQRAKMLRWFAERRFGRAGLELPGEDADKAQTPADKGPPVT
jgi:hypothetical protein